MKLLAVEAPATTYTCPMHPEVVSDEPGHCPECGMKLLPSQLVAERRRRPRARRPRARRTRHHDHAAAGGIEWEDDMVEVNRMTTPANMRWKLIDRDTGAENAAIDWRFRVGDRVKIRLVNEMDADHPMHHPFHVHGAGRFLILSRDGTAEPNLVWKDTVLVRDRRNRRHPAGRHQSRPVDGALPHRRAPRERHDVQLQGGGIAPSSNSPHTSSVSQSQPLAVVSHFRMASARSMRASTSGSFRSASSLSCEDAGEPPSVLCSRSLASPSEKPARLATWMTWSR